MVCQRCGIETIGSRRKRYCGSYEFKLGCAYLVSLERMKLYQSTRQRDYKVEKNPNAKTYQEYLKEAVKSGKLPKFYLKGNSVAL